MWKIFVCSQSVNIYIPPHHVSTSSIQSQILFVIFIASGIPCISLSLLSIFPSFSNDADSMFPALHPLVPLFTHRDCWSILLTIHLTAPPENQGDTEDSRRSVVHSKQTNMNKCEQVWTSVNKLGHFPASRRGFWRAHRRFAFVPDAVTLLPPLFSTTRSRAAGWSFWFVCLFSLESESSLLLQTYLQPTTNTRLVSSLTVNDGFLATTSTTTPSTVKPPQLAPMIVSCCCQENLLSGWRRAHKMPEEDTHCWVNLISCQTINRCVCSCLRMCAYNLYVR